MNNKRKDIRINDKIIEKRYDIENDKIQEVSDTLFNELTMSELFCGRFWGEDFINGFSKTRLLVLNLLTSPGHPRKTKKKLKYST